MFLKSRQGFSLVEALVGVAVFVLVSVAIYQGYLKIFDAIRQARFRIATSALANEQMEVVRNMPYSDVGVSGGIPDGKIPREQVLERDGIQFDVTTTVRNIDDPFDGTIGGEPNDLSPADYKLVEFQIACQSCVGFPPVRFTGRASPRNLETATDNGALFVEVFDANGRPVSGASVHVENNELDPQIIIDEETNNDGILQLVDVPPANSSYEISVSKNGYSSEQTYPLGDDANPNPVKPYATVVLQQVTQTSFAIDRTSTVNVSSVLNTCSSVGSIDFRLIGSKLIGIDPDVLKYQADFLTGGGGQLVLSDLEWDYYELSLLDAEYDLAGSMSLVPLNLAPDSTQDLVLVVAPKNPSSLLVTVRDAGTLLPLSDANVNLSGGQSRFLVTGQGFLRQTDWSGGGGQEDFIDPARFWDSDGNVETREPVGELRLLSLLDEHVPSGILTSSVFDTGTTSNFYQLTWEPTDQPPPTGEDSLRFQLAANNDRETWDFVGPDGTANTFYTIADTNISDSHDGDRYLRYRVFLNTENTNFTPNLAETAFTFSSSCAPPGQVFFDGLSADNYMIQISKTGYHVFEDTIEIINPWQDYEVLLVPE